MYPIYGDEGNKWQKINLLFSPFPVRVSEQNWRRMPAALLDPSSPPPPGCCCPRRWPGRSVGVSSSQLGPLPPDSQPSCGNTRIKINPGEKSNDWKQAEYQADIQQVGTGGRWHVVVMFSLGTENSEFKIWMIMCVFCPFLSFLYDSALTLTQIKCLNNLFYFILFNKIIPHLSTFNNKIRDPSCIENFSFRVLFRCFSSLL